MLGDMTNTSRFNEPANDEECTGNEGYSYI